MYIVFICRDYKVSSNSYNKMIQYLGGVIKDGGYSFIFNQRSGFECLIMKNFPVAWVYLMFKLIERSEFWTLDN